MTNSQRFLDAYNRTDRALHSRFGFKPSMSYSDAVRRAATMNAVVRKFEDELIDYGRLRNAIVHKSDSKKVIAEPHDDVTEKFESIAGLLEQPPLASRIAHPAHCVDPNMPLEQAVAEMAKSDFSIMPAVDGGRIVGALTNKDVVAFTAARLNGLDDAFKTAKVGDALSQCDVYYTVMRDCPIDEILEAFEKNRKLRMVVVTDGGTADGKLTGVITVGDLARITKMLESY